MVAVVKRILSDNPGIAKNTEERRQYYMGEVGEDRLQSPTVRRSREWFQSDVAKILIKSGFGQLPQPDLEPFCQWLTEHGEACPAWRDFSGTQSAFTENIGDQGQRGDPQDYSHVSAIPYVDSATLDNRMRGYYTSAKQRLERQYNDIPYLETLVLPNLQSWLDLE
jgi:hypothetical protein